MVGLRVGFIGDILWAWALIELLYVFETDQTYDIPRVGKPTRVPLGSLNPFENDTLAVVT